MRPRRIRPVKLTRWSAGLQDCKPSGSGGEGVCSGTARAAAPWTRPKSQGRGEGRRRWEGPRDLGGASGLSAPHHPVPARQGRRGTEAAEHSSRTTCGAGPGGGGKEPERPRGSGSVRTRMAPRAVQKSEPSEQRSAWMTSWVRWWTTSGKASAGDRRIRILAIPACCVDLHGRYFFTRPLLV